MPINRFFCIFCGTVLERTAESRADVIECPSCARHVPVPRLADVPSGPDGCGPIFPPDILELSVKFLCTACRSPIRADARWEGRRVVCPECHEKITIPRWSGVARWPSSADAHGKNTKPANLGPTRLTPDEIEFLSNTASALDGAKS